MSAVAPTLPVTPVAAITHGTPSAPHATGLTNLPPGLANLTSGTILNGSVVGRDAQGHVVVQTANGALTLATALPLSQGSQLSLQVQSVGAQIQMVVLSINQQPVPPGQPAAATLVLPGLPQGPHSNAALGGALVPPSGSTAPGAGASLAAGSPETVTVSPGVLTAIVVEEAPAAFGTGLQSLVQRAAASESASPILNALFNRAPREADADLPLKGTRLQVRILALDPGHAGEAKVAPRNVPGGGQASGLAAGPTEEIESGLPGGNAAAARTTPQTIAQTAAQNVSHTLAQALSAQGLTPDGRVLAQTRDGARLMLATVGEPTISGQVQLRTPLGVLSLSTKIPLPVESRLILEVMSQAQALETAANTASPAAGRGWPTLEEALMVLSKADGLSAEAPQGAPNPSALPPTLENVIPHNGPQLAQALIAAVAAIKTGDVRALLGDHTMRALDAVGRHDLVTRLGNDFQQLSSVVPDPTGDWRGLVIPVHDGNAMQYVRFYLRRNRKQANDGHDPDGTTRFLVNVDLSRIGAMQLDGLVKPKKFDLIVRTREALDNGMRRDIAKIFDDSLAATGQTGGVSFQASRPFAQLPQTSKSGVEFNV